MPVFLLAILLLGVTPVAFAEVCSCNHQTAAQGSQVVCSSGQGATAAGVSSDVMSLGSHRASEPDTHMEHLIHALGVVGAFFVSVVFCFIAT